MQENALDGFSAEVPSLSFASLVEFAPDGVIPAVPFSPESCQIDVLSPAISWEKARECPEASR